MRRRVLSLCPVADSDPEEFDTSILPESVRIAVEADTFWCLSRLLDGIQDNYIAGQPGIHRSVKRMAELVARIDGQYWPSVLLPLSSRTRVTACLTLALIYSAARRTPGGGERRVHAVRLPVDELSPHARD